MRSVEFRDGVTGPKPAVGNWGSAAQSLRASLTTTPFIITTGAGDGPDRGNRKLVPGRAMVLLLPRMFVGMRHQTRMVTRKD